VVFSWKRIDRSSYYILRRKWFLKNLRCSEDSERETELSNLNETRVVHVDGRSTQVSSSSLTSTGGKIKC